MNKVFIDTAFVVALVNPWDKYHIEATNLSQQYKNQPLLTTDVVLIEIGNALARNHKTAAVQVMDAFRSSKEITIISLDNDLFEKAFDLYTKYADKSWGLADCVSFIVMRDYAITDVLTSDRHFEQAGFNILMRK